MPRPKFVKPLLIGVACTIPVGLVVGLSVNWDHTTFIAAVGSSGVKPFIESFGKAYHEAYSNFDVTVESGGTTFAVEQLAQGYTNIGNASNNPYYVVNQQGFADQWKTKKTLTLGWEGLVVMYALPRDLTPDAKNNFEIVINKDNILQLYAMFSCYHELKGAEWKEDFESLWYYAPQYVQDKITNEDDINLLKKAKIFPFVRSAGNTGANSSIAFTYYSNLTEHDDLSDLTDKQQKAFAGGEYGNDNPHMETDESNARAWQSFEKNGKPGAMVYLTTSFLSDANLQAMKEHDYKLAKYQGKYEGDAEQSILNDQGKLNLDCLCMTHGYNWYRPINVMVDIGLKKATDFIYWMYFGGTGLYQDIVKKRGAKPLNEKQMRTMCANELGDITKENLFALEATDIKLLTSREEPFATVYGAEDIWE